MLRPVHLPIVERCGADWEAMAGDERRRFCGACEREVVHLSRMTADEALAMLERHVGGRVCVRYTVDAGGRVKFVEPRPRPPASAAVALATVLLAACTGFVDDEREPVAPEAGGVCSLADEAAGLCPREEPPPAPPERPPEPAAEESAPVASEGPAGRACDGVEAVPVPEDRTPIRSAPVEEREEELMGAIRVSEDETRHMRREARRLAREARRAARRAFE